MNLYRGVPKKICKKYLKEGIPPNSNFTDRLSGARNKGDCVIIVKKTKNFASVKESNRTFSQLKISERYYTNINQIKKFKIIKWQE